MRAADARAASAASASASTRIRGDANSRRRATRARATARAAMGDASDVPRVVVPEAYVRFAEALADAAGGTTTKYFRARGVEVEDKKDSSPVTIADQQAEAVMLGRRLLNKALASFETSLEELDESVFEQAFKELDVSSLDALLESLGLGNRMAHVVARRLVDVAHGDSFDKTLSDNSDKAVVISGSEGMVLNFARCCHPLPGDPVVGHLSVGKGLVVHRSECKTSLTVKTILKSCLPWSGPSILMRTSLWRCASKLKAAVALLLNWQA